jgi:hypothetical protein
MPLDAYEFDPTRDPRWVAFVEKHPSASVFHGAAWLKALQKTYRYEPMAFTTSPPNVPLKNALVFCQINSWLTGRRLVSLPFSDHCEPLCDSSTELEFLVHNLQSDLSHRKWRYLEMRPVTAGFSEVHGSFSPTAKYFLHVIDLRRDIDVLFRSFDRDSVQRRIQRAERAGLLEKCGTCDQLVEDFYRLFVLTRRRHRLPPIPGNWFWNLIQDHGLATTIRGAYSDTKPIAAILTLGFRDVVYYKYGCSDQAYNGLGGMPWLLWNAILAAKSSGALQFDMGRTEETHTGLLAFKNHWVSQPRALVYWNFPAVSAVGPAHGWKMRVAQRIFSTLPENMLVIAGNLFYRHIG